MIGTEKAMSKKWCPYSRTGAYADFSQTHMVTTNRDPREDVQESCNCIGSKCAVWEWVDNCVPSVVHHSAGSSYPAEKYTQEPFDEEKHKRLMGPTTYLRGYKPEELIVVALKEPEGTCGLIQHNRN